MKLEKTTAVLVALIVASLTVLVALGKIDGGEYVKLLAATIVPACFPALAKLTPKPPPAGPSVLDDDVETVVRAVPTVRPLRRTDDELLAAFRGADTWPPPPAAAVLLAIIFFTGCHPSSQFEENAKTAAVYEAELMACVAKAETLAESRACRCEVNQRWDRACTDVIGSKP